MTALYAVQNAVNLCFRRKIQQSIFHSSYFHKFSMNATNVNDSSRKTAEEIHVSKNEKTFQYQEKLPSLPVPSLDHTLNRYLSSVSAIATEEEYKETEAIVKEFRNGVGQILHNKLLERAQKMRNWLEDWWNNTAYLTTRFPTAPDLIVAGPSRMIEQFFLPEDGSQIERAALITYYTLHYWKLLHRENLAVQKTRSGLPLCMNQYRNLFSSCKVPRKNIDSFGLHFKTVSEDDRNFAQHIVVQKSGRFFYVDVIDPQGEPILPPELEFQLRKVEILCDSEGPAVGALTADYRDKWAENREHLRSLHPENIQCLKAIETSLFNVILSDSHLHNKSEACREGLLGDCRNRWFDKAYSSVISKNGVFASCCDHSPLDGMVTTSLSNFVDNKIYETQGKWQGPSRVCSLPEPHELKFHVDSHILKAIDKASILYNGKVNNIEVKHFDFKGFGKSELKALHVHPDYFVQVVLQVAYYRLYQKPAPTYETATIRTYYHGRTETLRTCTSESVDFAKAMYNNSMQSHERYQMFLNAISTLTKLMGEATKIQGCDRHLMGLRILAAEEGLADPLLYNDPAWKKSGGDANFIISSSCLGYMNVIGMTGPMCTHGYGTFYAINASQIEFTLSAFKADEDTSCDLWEDSLKRSLNDVMTLVLANKSKL